MPESPQRMKITAAIAFCACVIIIISCDSKVGAANDHQWNYTSQEAWKHVPGWNCNGIRQSPISIDVNNLIVNNELIDPILWNFEYLYDGTFTNNGHSVRFDPATGSPTAIFKNHLGTYEFLQFHFHWGRDNFRGSEHRILYGANSGEVHFVTKKTTGVSTDEDAFSVLGVFLIGNDFVRLSGSWEKLYSNMPIKYHGVNSVNGVRLDDFLPPNFTLGRYYHYEGSLTTPPCSETVQWFVLQEPVYVSNDFLVKLRTIQEDNGEALTMNYRYTQPMNGRQVTITSSHSYAQFVRDHPMMKADDYYN